MQYEIEQYVNHTFKPEFDRNFKIGDKVYISIMKFLVALIVLLSFTFSSNASYNNPSGSYAYDIGYNSGYIHGSSGRSAESNYGRSYDFIEGYNDGY